MSEIVLKSEYRDCEIQITKHADLDGTFYEGRWEDSDGVIWGDTENNFWTTPEDALQHIKGFIDEEIEDSLINDHGGMDTNEAKANGFHALY